ncbi:MAG: hypothetical protein FJ215_12415 [Ignavibacteria bacterium]|nr:hypothetical protein [Ignavibacteria bacterium]
MIDDRHRELINASIDGQLSEQEREYLGQYLAANPEAKVLHDQLTELSRALSVVSHTDPPPQLRESILRTVRIKHGEQERRSPIFRWTATFGTRNRFAFAYVFSAGIILGVALSAVIWNLERETRFDDRDLTGTLATPPTRNGYIHVERKDFAEGIVQGSLEIRRAGNSILADLVVNSAEEVEVITQYNENEMRLTGFRHVQEGISDIAVSEGRVQFKNKGDNQYLLFLNDREPVGGMLHLRIYSATGLLVEYRTNVISGK